MKVRRADKRDLPSLVNLLYQVQDVHAKGRPDLFNSGARKYRDDELLMILADDSRPIFVAVEANEVLGYAFCVLEETPPSASLKEVKSLYVDDLCVDACCRGRHVGTALYQFVLNFAREQGCYRVTLNVWALNEAASAFYEKMGMSPLKTTMEKLL